MAVGGGAMPLIAVTYFWSLHNNGRYGPQVTPEQSVNMIDSFKGSRSDLSADELSALDEIIEAIKSRKYRAWYMVSDPGKPWAK